MAPLKRFSENVRRVVTRWRAGRPVEGHEPERVKDKPGRERGETATDEHDRLGMEVAAGSGLSGTVPLGRLPAAKEL